MLTIRTERRAAVALPGRAWGWSARAAGLALALAVLALLTPAGAQAQGKGNGVEVLAVTAALDAASGSILSIPFRVTNKANSPVDLLESLRLPPGWRTLIPPSDMTLAPGESTIRTLPLQVPYGTAAGRYEIGYLVRGQKDPAVQDQDATTINVLSLVKLAMMLEEKPDMVIAGRDFQCRVRLVNQGNGTLALAIRATVNAAGYAPRVEPATLSLPPGGSEVVVITVATDKKEPRPVTRYVQVDAAEDGKARATLAVGVDVIPLITRSGELTRVLPTTLALRLGGEAGKSGYQLSWQGAGAVDDAGERRVDFLFQGPGSQQTGVFGWQEQYRLAYTTQALGLRLGDQSYGLSPLTDYCRYGRGIGVDLQRARGGSLGAYYVRSPSGGARASALGAYVSPNTGRDLRLKLNLLLKRAYSVEDARTLDDRLWSIEAGVKPSRSTDLQLEYGANVASGAARGSAAAYSGRWQGRIGNGGYYSLQKTHSAPDYPGYYHDSDRTLANVSLSLARGVQASANYSLWKQNLEQRSYQSTAPRESRQQVALNYQPDSHWNASLGYERASRQDLSLPADYDTQESLLRLKLGRSSGNYSWDLQFADGNRRDMQTLVSSRTQDYRLFASYRPAPGRSFTVYGGRRVHGGEGSLTGGDNQVGASTTWSPSTALSLTAWYTGYNVWGGGRKSEQGEAAMRYALTGGRTLELRARLNSGGAQGTQASYLVCFTMPLGLPVNKRKSVGILLGRVYDARLPLKPGIPDVVLTLNGAAAVTDKRGRFIFPALPPGTYTLNADRKSVGIGRVTDVRLPLQVVIKGGASTTADLGVVDGATLSGAVMLVPKAEGDGGNGADGEGYIRGDPTKGTQGAEPRGLPGVLVEMNCGNEVLRRATDSTGHFLFESLLPGKWQLKVYDNNLPPYHYLETPTTDLTLAGGQHAEVAVRVVPRIRRIKMIDDADGETLTTTTVTPASSVKVK